MIDRKGTVLALQQIGVNSLNCLSHILLKIGMGMEGTQSLVRIGRLDPIQRCRILAFLERITLDCLLPAFIPGIGITVRHRPAKINRRRNSRTRISIAGVFLKLIIELDVARQLRLHDQERTVLIRNAHGIVVALIVRIHFVSNHSYWFVSLCCRTDTLTSDIETALARKVVALAPICKFFSSRDKSLRFLQVFLTPR